MFSKKKKNKKCWNCLWRWGLLIISQSILLVSRITLNNRFSFMYNVIIINTFPFLCDVRCILNIHIIIIVVLITFYIRSTYSISWWRDTLACVSIIALIIIEVLVKYLNILIILMLYYWWYNIYTKSTVGIFSMFSIYFHYFISPIFFNGDFIIVAMLYQSSCGVSELFYNGWYVFSELVLEGLRLYHICSTSPRGGQCDSF